MRGENYLPHWLNRIGKNNFLVGVPLWFVVSTMVDKFHLLEHRRLQQYSTVSRRDQWQKKKSCTHLAWFTSSQQQHLNFVLGHHTVPFELALDSIVTCTQIMISKRRMWVEWGVDLRALASLSASEDCTQPIFWREYIYAGGPGCLCV